VLLIFLGMPAPPFQNRQESIRREDHPFSNWEIFQRLVGLCAHRKLLLFSVLLLQALLLVMQVAGLSYLGVGIDFLRFQYDRTGGPPTWPFGLAPPANWAPFTIVLIAASAALIAERLHPGSVSSMIAAHESAEPGHAAVLDKLGLRPFLRWNMRLGEGTGALLLMPLLDAAAAIVANMGTFSKAGIPKP